jgi:hypothetical protein
VTPRGAHEIRESVRATSLVMSASTPLKKGAKGAVISALNRYCGEEHRKVVIAWLFQRGDVIAPLSSKELTEGQWRALYDWVGYWKDEDTMEWRVCDDFPIEAAYVLTDALRAFLGVKNEVRAKFAMPPEMVLRAVELDGVITAVDDRDTLVYGVEIKPDIIETTKIGTLLKSKKVHVDF